MTACPIPALEQQPVWLLWKSAPAADGGKPRKLPFYSDGTPRRGRLDAPEDRARLVTFAAAVAAMGPAYAGLGVALGDVSGEALELFPEDRTTEKPAPGEGIHEGGRNSSLTTIAGQLRRINWEQPRIAAALTGINAAEVVPPLQGEEIEAIARSVCRYPPKLNEWPDPLNLFAELVAPAYSPESVPAELSGYASAFSRASGIDSNITFGAAIVAAASALSDEFCIVGDAGSQWTQEARIWGLVVAPPGAGKSPAQKKMTDPLWQIQSDRDAAHSAHCAQLPDGEKPPHRERLIVADTTIEALSEVLRHQPRGLLIANDEFEGWLGAMDMYRRGGGASRDRGEWLRLFDGGPQTVERVQRGSVFVPNFGVSILTATTPSALAKVMRQLPEDGLLQRFIPVLARRQIITDGDSSSLKDLRAIYEQTLRRLFAMQPRAHHGRVPLGYDAAAFFRQWRAENQRHAEAMGYIAPALESHIAKYPALLLRLALIFHACKVVAMDAAESRDPAAWPVSGDTMRQAAAYLKTASRHALALYGSIGGASTAYELGRTCARALLALNAETVERRHLIQRVRAFRSADSNEQDAALRLLTDAGWLRVAEGGYDLARPARFEINPQVRELFAKEAAAETQRRAAVREAIADTVEARP